MPRDVTILETHGCERRIDEKMLHMSASQAVQKVHNKSSIVS